MSDIVIKVENLSKQYRLGDVGLGSLRHDVNRWWHGVRGKEDPYLKIGEENDRYVKGSSEYVWALRDINLEVKQGEILGIIGRNGAGKSTLLKILSRTTTPTSGQIKVKGRIASLLEVGTGFHPELTGRENIYLNAAILGMRKAEVEKKFDEIVAFAEIERFIDTPVKRYSSGMYMRLAFAVAAHLEPEILLVDEVLAVGDAAFQKKCLGKMGDVAQEGRTIVFVSHNLLAIQDLCDRVIWIDQGKILEDGLPGQVVSRYLQTSFSSLTERIWADKATAPGNDEIRLHRALIRPADGGPEDPTTVQSPLQVELEYWNLVEDADLTSNLLLYNEQGILVFESAPIDEPIWLGAPRPIGLYRDTCFVPGNLLNAGVHRIVMSLVKDQGTVLHREDDILVFDVRDSMEKRGGWFGGWSGAVRPILDWTTELLPESIADGRAQKQSSLASDARSVV